VLDGGPDPLTARGRGVGENFAHCTTRKRLTESQSCLGWRFLVVMIRHREEGEFDVAYIRLLWLVVFYRILVSVSNMSSVLHSM